MEKIKIILTVILSIIFIDNLQSQNSKVFPDSTWLKHDTIENVGYDSKKFNEINRFIIDSLNTTGLVVIVDGKILFDYGDIDELSYIASCRKSILSMIYGKYVENNTINLDETLEELEFDDIQGLLLSRKRQQSEI
ncbi:hypothetical protein [Marinifilum fragile]|uniref:hypothetical protein n=1 Tax=Marinifilum fragile TaxID=570161 RepID=UPI0006D27243|nr:hypothetical protein [Marinifilum fragile]